jgi:hypothetical protein
MNRKKERFKLEEKDSRLDVRITRSLRERLEIFCREKSWRLTDAVVEALEDFLKKQQEK